jgi:hypothetical protein
VVVAVAAVALGVLAGTAAGGALGPVVGGWAVREVGEGGGEA